MQFWEIIDRRSGNRAITMLYQSESEAGAQITAWNRKGCPDNIHHLEPRPIRVKENSDD